MLSHTLRALALASLPLALATASCGPPPKQAEVADVDKESGVDMASPDDASGAPADTGGDQDEMRTKCCAECKTGADKDRTGASKDTIPCADFTDTLSPWCLEYFRSHSVMASKCE